MRSRRDTTTPYAQDERPNVSAFRAFDTHFVGIRKVYVRAKEIA